MKMRKTLMSGLCVVAIVGWWIVAGGTALAADGAESAEHAVTASDAQAESGDSHATGVPLDFKADLALWSLVVFLIFMFVLKKFAWKPLAEGLDAREQRIRSDIDSAEAARVKAEQMLADHESKLAGVQEEVKEILAEARRDAEHTKNEIMAVAQGEAEATRDRALGDIERARDQALKDLFDQVATQVTSATEHVLGRSLDASDQQRLIAEALADVTAGSG
jgi:F-type H+-transporting ATPase subunit b